MDIMRSIFECDAVDEGLQSLKEKATELNNTHGDELKETALSFLNRLRSPKNENHLTDG